MANKERGEVSLVAREKTYTLVMRTNYACELQAATGRPVQDIFNEAVGIVAGNKKRTYPSLVALRWLVWGALQEHYSDEIKTPKDAGRFIDDAGGLDVVIPVMMGFVLSNSKPNGIDKGSGADAGERQDPILAQASANGNNFTSMRVASA